MADDADSKSVVGNHVWVQVPLPAVNLRSQNALLISVLASFLLLSLCICVSNQLTISQNAVVIAVFFIKIKDSFNAAKIWISIKNHLHMLHAAYIISLKR